MHPCLRPPPLAQSPCSYHNTIQGTLGLARVFVEGHTTSVTILLNDIPSWMKFHLEWNSINATTLSGQGFQRRNLHDAGVGKSAWIFCTAKSVRQKTAMARTGTLPDFLYQKGNRSWRKNRPFFKQCGSHRHQLRIQHQGCRRLSYRVRFKQWWRNLWGWRSCRGGY